MTHDELDAEVLRLLREDQAKHEATKTYGLRTQQLYVKLLGTAGAFGHDHPSGVTLDDVRASLQRLRISSAITYYTPVIGWRLLARKTA